MLIDRAPISNHGACEGEALGTGPAQRGGVTFSTQVRVQPRCLRMKVSPPGPNSFIRNHWPEIPGHCFLAIDSWLQIPRQEFLARNPWPEIHGEEFLARNSWRGIPGEEYVTRNPWPGINDQKFLARESWSTSLDQGVIISSLGIKAARAPARPALGVSCPPARAQRGRGVRLGMSVDPCPEGRRRSVAALFLRGRLLMGVDAFFFRN